MTKTFLRLSVFTVTASLLVPLVTALASQVLGRTAPRASDVATYLLALVIAGVTIRFLVSHVEHAVDSLDAIFAAQVAFLDALPSR